MIAPWTKPAPAGNTAIASLFHTVSQWRGVPEVRRSAKKMTTSLALPKELTLLISDGLWPDVKSAQMQNLRPLIPKEIVRQFAPDEEAIFLYAPPFATIAEARKHNNYWEHERSAIGEIDPGLSLIIGDFGLGSDTAIILDYRAAQPRLLRLQWGAEENHWVDCGLSVAELAAHVRKYRAEPFCRSRQPAAVLFAVAVGDLSLSGFVGAHPPAAAAQQSVIH